VLTPPSRPLPPAALALADAVRARHGEAVRAVLVYGSCYRTGDLDGVFDLYVLVESYRAFYGRRAPAAANRVLPPNVFWLQAPFAGGAVRAKYAVLSLADFARGTAPRARHSYFWARFAQPVGVAYTSDAAVARQVAAGLDRAITTFVGRVAPVLPDRFDAETLWRRGLALTYGAELRAERSDRAGQLYAADAAHYEAVTRAAIPGLPWRTAAVETPGGVRYEAAIPPADRARARRAWAARQVLGKALSVLRLVKGLFTFEGGLDYVAWKIQRHSGVAVELPAAARRRPLLAGWLVAWRLYRKGAFR
jgi:hypothetical protein